jgi:hypothetical protein
MIRARFTVDVGDYRPVVWPVKHPYWCTGYGSHGPVLVAYADNEGEILTNWPEAENIESEPVSEYMFNSRFPRPDWFTQSPAAPTPPEGA